MSDDIELVVKVTGCNREELCEKLAEVLADLCEEEIIVAPKIGGGGPP